MIGRIVPAATAAGLLAVATTTLALAWPDQPPERAVISGPGITGVAEVTDEQALTVFRLGTLEGFGSYGAHPSVTPPVDSGYRIVRFFDGGEFDFARLTYYPDPSGGRGRVYFEDGPMLEGDHTAYDERWLFVKPESEKRLQALLRLLGAGLGGEEPTPAAAVTSTSLGGPSKPVSASGSSTANPAAASGPGEAGLLSWSLIPLARGWRR